MMTLLVGTNRPDSNTRKIATQVEGIYRTLNVPLRELDLAKLPPEIFSPSSYAEKPASFLPFSDGVLAASGLIVVSPEYNGSIPGVLKYFIDMLKFPESFERRPVCFIAWPPASGARSGRSSSCRPSLAIATPSSFPNASSFRA
jgi:NAD(P)H-dependent FMN reductase